jgi:site-specific recombinase XerD
MDNDLERFRTWLVGRGREAETAAGYVYDVRSCLEADNVTSRLIDRDLAPKTRRRMVAAMRSWATFSKDADLLLLLRDIKLPPSKRKTPRQPLPVEDWHRLVEAVEESRVRPAIKGTLLIICVRGIRVGDVLRLRRTEIHQALRTGRLVLEAKGGARQDFTAKPMLAGLELLAEQPGRWERVEDLISPDTVNIRKAARRRVHRALRRLAKSVGIDPAEVYPHRLRRTYAVEFLRAMKGDPEAMQKLVKQMGWLNAGTAFEYTDFISSESLDEIDERIRRK